MLTELSKQELNKVIGGANLLQLSKDHIFTIYVDKDGRVVCGRPPTATRAVVPNFPKPSPTNPRPRQPVP